ncbi:MAG: hypothetical protein KatS3mg129_0893 [Leptospiraceae bacterium]|nr:MAG: hypothetical protein KatS3mg129_0893 [Leptospiraceae bacterium]
MRKIFFILFLFILGYCNTIKDRIPTGIEKYYQSNGKIVLIATAKASKNAIEKNSTAMMQATSKEAATLLLKNELQKSEYQNIKNKFKITYVEFINNGEYCKITAEYIP